MSIFDLFSYLSKLSYEHKRSNASEHKLTLAESSDSGCGPCSLKLRKSAGHEPEQHKSEQHTPSLMRSVDWKQIVSKTTLSPFCCTTTC